MPKRLKEATATFSKFLTFIPKLNKFVASDKLKLNPKT
jgi:hypothetical protein